VAAEGQHPDEGIVIKNVVDEIGRATLGECPVSVDCLARIVKAMAFETYPHLNGVRSPNDAQIVVHVKRGADFLVE